MAALQNGWADEYLIPSIFIRSEDYGVGIPYSTTGEGEAVFSNFEILEGDAVRAVPEPSTYAAIFGGIALLIAIWRRKIRK